MERVSERPPKYNERKINIYEMRKIDGGRPSRQTPNDRRPDFWTSETLHLFSSQVTVYNDENTDKGYKLIAVPS